jgi:hypothetical protein
MIQAMLYRLAAFLHGKHKKTGADRARQLPESSDEAGGGRQVRPPDFGFPLGGGGLLTGGYPLVHPRLITDNRNYVETWRDLINPRLDFYPSDMFQDQSYYLVHKWMAQRAGDLQAIFNYTMALRFVHFCAKRGWRFMVEYQTYDALRLSWYDHFNNPIPEGLVLMTADEFILEIKYG